MKRKVYVPNLPTRYDAATRQNIPSIDLNGAAQFGELVTLTTGPIRAADLHESINLMADAAAKVEPPDIILCVGDVVLMAALIAYVTESQGHANLLRWDRVRRAYEEVEVAL